MPNFYTTSKVKEYSEFTEKSVEEKSKSIPVSPDMGDIRYDDTWDFSGPKQKERCLRRGPAKGGHKK